MPEQAQRPLLALDAMGVLYAAGDDVAELLIPFVHGQGSRTSPEEVEREYLAASLGEIDADTFWRRLGLDPAIEDEYLSGHRLGDGVMDLLKSADLAFCGICCLSNDVARWSEKLRRTFSLDRVIDPWVISADVGLRKPSPGIYAALLNRVGLPADRILFVDDRPKNLDAARAIGMRTALFDPTGADTRSEHTKISQLSELLDIASP